MNCKTFTIHFSVEEQEQICSGIVVSISEQAKEGRLRWLGHVIRRESESGVRRAYETPVKEKRSRRRQKLRWRDIVKRGMK